MRDYAEAPAACQVAAGAAAAAFARVWTGHVTFAQAVRTGGVQVDGPRDLVHAFPTWLLLSHFAHVERPVSAGRELIRT